MPSGIYKKSPEHIAKIKKNLHPGWMKGKKLSEETKDKIRESLKGNIPWNKGKKCPEVSKRQKGKSIPWFKKYEYKKGEMHSNWKGGICRNKHYLGRKEYRDWRTSVFERDNYTCRICEELGGEINAHHIKEWALYPDLRFDISNGLTLCKECHFMWHHSRKLVNGKWQLLTKVQPYGK